MAPKILLADDSMTAQNMGRKILAEGGYEVVAVSNGAAALKKIAEAHPELVILDVYMPGYTGLEVCERLRGALATAHLPVVLTVGKLEPFKPEEGNRVKADGLLVKPFEATDLLATVKKLLEKATATAPPAYEDTVKLEPPAAAGFSDASYEAWKTETPAEYEDTQKIEVPQEIAAAPAMGEPLETPPPGPPMAMAAAAAAVPAFSVEPEPAMPEFIAAPAPAFDLDLHLDEPESSVPAFTEPSETTAATADSILDALMPELETNAPTPAPALVETAPDLELNAPQAQDVTAEPLPDLEPTVLQDAIPVEVASDADLVTTPEELAHFTTTFGVENPEEIAVGLVADLPTEQAAALTAPDPVSEAAAPEEIATVATEAEPAPQIEVAPEPVVEEVAAPELDLPVAEPAPEPTPLELTPAEAEPLAEPAVVVEPPPGAVTEAALPEPAVAQEDISLEEELQRAFADVPPAEPAPESGSVAEVPIPEAIAAVPTGEDAMAQLVERVIERLKPELVAAIVKELKG